MREREFINETKINPNNVYGKPKSLPHRNHNTGKIKTDTAMTEGKMLPVDRRKYACFTAITPPFTKDVFRNGIGRYGDVDDLAGRDDGWFS